MVPPRSRRVTRFRNRELAVLAMPLSPTRRSKRPPLINVKTRPTAGNSRNEALDPPGRPQSLSLVPRGSVVPAGIVGHKREAGPIRRGSRATSRQPEKCLRCCVHVSRPTRPLRCRGELQSIHIPKVLPFRVDVNVFRRPNGPLAKLQAGSHAKATRHGSCRANHCF
jgi:hypothetical protein